MILRLLVAGRSALRRRSKTQCAVALPKKKAPAWRVMELIKLCEIIIAPFRCTISLFWEKASKQYHANFVLIISLTKLHKILYPGNGQSN